jgi:hypothetical protein
MIENVNNNIVVGSSIKQRSWKLPIDGYNLLRNAEGRSSEVRNSEVVGDERVRRERNGGEKSKAEEKGREQRTSRRHKVRFFFFGVDDHKSLRI